MKRTLIGILLLGLIPSAVMACLWDFDTVFMERQRFPKTLEVITGKFLRHTPAFYQWRLEDRARRLESNPNELSLYDDIAVAYDKLGQPQKAIETILKKDAISPGLYETLANLGTFHIHAGDLERGVEFLEQALKINPDAHFGREKYQILLVKYVLKRRGNGPLRLPLALDVDSLRHTNFADFLIETDRAHSKPSDVSNAVESSPYEYRELTPVERSAAIKGILGMMHFGKFDSPVLLEALGDVLCHGHAAVADNARLLGVRAYLKASMEAPTDSARSAYLEIADQARGFQAEEPGTMRTIELATIENELQAELKEANDWFKVVEQREAEWIAKGLNADEEFVKTYRTDPSLNLPIKKEIVRRTRFITPERIVFVVIVTLLFLGKIRSVYHKLQRSKLGSAAKIEKS